MNTTTEYMKEVLKLVAMHDGKWSWYQLDRTLSARGLISPTPLTTVLRDAEGQGLLRSLPGASPSQPVYQVTDDGKALIA